ncbi:hypothetical protein BGZ65_011629, partial [Modicella reniformis]
MLRLTRTHSMPVSTTGSSSNSVSHILKIRRSRTNAFSFPTINFHRTLSERSNKGESSSTPSTSLLSGVSLAAIIADIHRGNFLQLSDYNLNLLIRSLAGKNSSALHTIDIKSATISSADARHLARLIRSSDAANIKVLKLDRNAISQDAFKHLFEPWKQNRTITTLSLSRSGVDDKAIKYLAKAMAK